MARIRTRPHLPARLVAVACVVVVLGAVAPSAADDAFVVVGSVAVANPASKTFSGVTESSNPCGQPHPRLGDTSGIDGYWIALPDWTVGRAASLRSDAVDADVWFYRMSDEGCVLIEATDDANWTAMSSELTPDEDGFVPIGADYAIVDAAIGDGVAFTFTVQ